MGLVVGALILVMSITGGLLVLHHDLERLLFPERHMISVADAEVAIRPDSSPSRVSARAPIAEIVQRLATEAPPGYRPLRIELAREADETEKYLFVATNGRTRWAAFVNPVTGAVVWQGPDQALFTPWLLHLHMHLRTGGWGYVVTAAIGACLLLLGVTGLFLYRGGFGKVLRQPMRLRQGWRKAITDLHRWVGLVSLYFSIVLGLTGAIYAGKTAPGQIAAPKPAGVAFDVQQLAPVEPVLATTAQRFPGTELVRVALPTRANAPLIVTVLHRDAPVWQKFSRMEFDPATGALRAVRAGAEASRSEKFAATLTPLHFGLYGSDFTKAAYAIGGFAPALLATSGMLMWWLRRRRATVADEGPLVLPEELRPAAEQS